jgi:hypothetical protein
MPYCINTRPFPSDVTPPTAGTQNPALSGALPPRSQSGVAKLTPNKSGSGFTVLVQMKGRNVQDGEHDQIHNLSCARYARIAPKPRTPTGNQINQQLATVATTLDDIFASESGRGKAW